MFVERVYDVHSKMFRFMEENELVGEEEREALERFSRNRRDSPKESGESERNLLKSCRDPALSYIRGKIRGKF